MEKPFYSGKPEEHVEGPAVKLPVSPRARHEDPRGYEADEALADAVNVALMLGQPLLVTGEPGTGKTQLAYSVAWELNWGDPLKFETKSSSTARDLFYTFDHLGLFRAVQANVGSKNALDHITYNALGKAILHARAYEKVKHLLPAGYKFDGPRRHVVLIDEIDKAPRDFPNDILNEIEGMYFRITELGNEKVEADKEMRPVLILTSNSEKSLPDAFLRRCVYYNIEFPGEKEGGLRKIVARRLGDYVGESSPLLSDALALFYKLRERNSGLRKKPATAEFLGWLIALRLSGLGAGDGLRREEDGKATEAIEKTLCVLIKAEEDLVPARAIIQQWLPKKNTTQGA
ncbi:MAG TPA: MoxR family ATPase [Pyrinomonadaceae bacterium]|nr:MoxR family ATPase [Pyrinomonadaceae bacterium]